MAQFVTNRQLILTTVVAAVLAASTLGNLACAKVEVRTADGRILSGVIDSSSTQDQLWLRVEQDGIVLSTAVAWESIAKASLDGDSIGLDELRQYANESASESPTGYLVAQGPPIKAVAHSHQHFQVGQITSLEIQARLMNFDHTVEPDGFEVAIAAIDELGQAVPVRGNLYVRLQGERNLHYSGRIRFDELQRWTQPVSPYDFEEGVALYALRFRDFAPEFNDELRPDAQINARLGIFGQGNFSATVPVPLWEFNPFRDRLQKFDGSRFFRDEVTHRPRHLSNDPPGIYRKVWRRWE